MTKVIKQSNQTWQQLRELAGREQKIRNKWVSFKKKLRATKGLDPDYTDHKFREEEAKFDAAMKLIEERRAKVIAKAPEE